MSSLVLELQREAMDQSVSVTSLLRRAQVAARKLALSEFAVWVGHEQGGYPTEIAPPSYRRVPVILKCLNPYHGWRTVQFEDSKLGEKLSKRTCVQSIPELEVLLTN